MAKIFSRENRIDWFIFLLTLVMCLGIACLPFKAKPLGDFTFHDEARNLAFYLKGGMPYEKVMITKAPGPVFLFAFTYLFAPVGTPDATLWYYGVVVNALLAAGAVVLIHKAARRMFGESVALLATFFAFLFPIHCYYVLSIIGEVSAFFGVALAAFGWSLILSGQMRFKSWLWLSLGIFILILNRPNAMLLPALGIGFTGLAYFRNKELFARLGKQTIVSMVAVIACGFAVLEFAKAVTADKSTTDQSAYFYYVAHQGRYEFREEPLDWRYWQNDFRGDSKDYQNWNKNMHRLNDKARNENLDRNQLYKEYLIQDAKEHPFWLVRSFVVKCIYGNFYFVNGMRPEQFKLGPFTGPTGYWIVMAIVNIINILIVIGSFLFLIRTKGLIKYWPLWGSMLALLIFHGITYMEPRYIFPPRAAIYIMSAAGLCSLGFVRKLMDKLASRLY